MNHIVELYLPIKGFEGLYEVSNLGNVRSIARGRNTGRVLRQHTRGGRYLGVTLSKENKTKSVWVHRLVAQAFLPNGLGKKTVNHIDGNPANNHISNLEWATYAENMRHASDTLGITPWNKGTAKTEERVCEDCGNVFTALKYGSENYCSRVCSKGIDF